MRGERQRFFAGVWLLVAAACGSQNSGQADTFTLPDATADLHGGADTATADDAADEAAGTDAAAAETALDAAPVDVTVDSGPQDAAPHIKKLAAFALAQGASTTLDLNPLIADAEDSNDKLTLVWSAQHVALKDPGTHLLYIVAPTNWSGTEAIDVTVRDTAGLTATETLFVTVTEVKVDPPQPADTCGKAVFAVAAGAGQHIVLLSGSFNGWGKDANTADVMTDPAASGTWKVEKTLAPGVYQYKFIVDGVWQADSNNPNQVPDGFGGKNSVVEVPQCKP